MQEIQKPRRCGGNTRGGRGVLIILITLFIFPLANAQVEKLKIGMSHAEFNSVMENLIPGKNNYNGYIKENRTIQNLSFGMHGEIKDDTLRNMWAATTTSVEFEDDVTAEKAKKSLENYVSTTKYLYSSFARTYGEGKPSVDKTQNFSLTKESNSDTIFKCTWHDKDKTVILALLFKSSKREQNAFQFENHINNANVDMDRSELRIFMSMKGKEAKENIFGLACGMNAATVYKENKALMPNGYFTTGTWYKKTNVYGVEDDWRFEFENGKLLKYSFETELYDSDMYDEENTLTDKKYTKYMASAKSLVMEYKKTYGTPVSSSNGPGSLKEARKKMDELFPGAKFGKESINIVSAQWKSGTQEIIISLQYNKWVSKDTRVVLGYKVEVK